MIKGGVNYIDDRNSLQKDGLIKMSNVIIMNFIGIVICYYSIKCIFRITGCHFN